MTSKSHTFHFDYQLFSNWSQLAADDVALAEHAFDAMKKAYAPYSKFLVGAALQLENGAFISGNNQENIAFPSGLCAERVALFYAGATYPDQKIKTICIVAQGELMPQNQLLSPCGACRQVMLESENRQNQAIRVILINQDGRTMLLHKVLDLLPFGFGNFQ